MRKIPSPIAATAASAALAVFLAGCATGGSYKEARTLVESGNEEEGLARMAEQLKENPDDTELRNYYLRHRAVALERFLAMGEQARAAGAFDRAEEQYRRALRLDPENARAAQGLRLLETDRANAALLAEAQAALKGGDEAAAYAKAGQALAADPRNREARAIVRRIDEKNAKAAAAPPELDAALKKPITLEFRDAPLRSVFELIAKHTGLNFIFDKDVAQDLKATVFVRNSSIEDVIRFVLVTNQLERKVLNENTILVYPNTPAKQQSYKDLVVRSFYLANADAKQTANMIKSVVKTRDMFVDEKLNILVMRDTPEAVRMAEKLVANQDLGEAEVMLEVEVLEVSTNLLQELGVQWPTQISAGIVGAGGTPGVITGREARNFNSSLVRLAFGDPLVAINLKKQDGRTNVLANPRIRVKNREKARIHIGDKVPVITTTATATGFLGENVSYLDVGLKLEVEPLIYLENDVGIKVGLEVSNIAREIRSRSGTVTYQVGTRNAATSLRLKDGETQVLAGLISDEDRRSADKVPGLSDMPVLGRLFQSKSDTRNKTEIVLLITPRVVRNLARPDIRLEEFSGGTDAMLGGDPMTLQPVPGGAPVPPLPGTPVPGAPAAPPPAPAAPAAPAAAPFGGASMQPNSVPGGPGAPAPVR